MNKSYLKNISDTKIYKKYGVWWISWATVKAEQTIRKNIESFGTSLSIGECLMFLPSSKKYRSVGIGAMQL